MRWKRIVVAVLVALPSVAQALPLSFQITSGGLIAFNAPDSGLTSWGTSLRGGEIVLDGQLEPGGLVEIVDLRLEGLVSESLPCSPGDACLIPFLSPVLFTLDSTRESVLSLNGPEGSLRPSGSIALIITSGGQSVSALLAVEEFSVSRAERPPDDAPIIGADFALTDFSLVEPLPNLLSETELIFDGVLSFEGEPPDYLFGLEIVHAVGQIPEPASVALLVLGLVGVALGRRLIA